MRITTLPVYSKLAAEDVVKQLGLSAKLPPGWRLSQHQVETYQALTSGDYDVVINTAMTGDGKSLAAQLPALGRGDSLMTMYPTNELIRDQAAQTERTLREWQPMQRFNPTIVTSPELREIVARGAFARKADALRSLAANHEILLTNPDIFHYIAQFFYTRRNDAPDYVIGHLIDLFNLLTFDEFHIFQAPQVVSVLNAMLLIRRVTGPRQPKRFLFLSATPAPLLTEYLARAGFRVKVIAPAETGGYLHTADTPDLQSWRSIIQACDIEFDTLNAEQWVEAHLDDALLPFFAQHHPGAKGAIIVNSVAAAHRLVERLRGPFEARGWKVLPNTGLTDKAAREASRKADLLIGTSTVDVGVDFRINFLLFESRDAGTFLQRLGRLGRHETDEQGHRFQQYAAYALVPPFVKEQLFDGRRGEPPLLAGRKQLTRAELGEAIRIAYPQPFEFRSYARQWGWIQSAHVYGRLWDKTVRDTYANTRQQLRNDYGQTFNIAVDRCLPLYLNLKEETPQLVEETQSFRGGSPFNCGVVDESGLSRLDADAPGERVLTYDLFMLARNATLEWLGRDAFKEIARARDAAFTDTEIDQMAGWFRLRGLTEPRQCVIRVNAEVATWGADCWGQAQVLQGIALELDQAEWLNDLNRHLAARKYVALLCLTDPQTLTKRLSLPPLFEIHKFISRDGLEGSIAFAREALMLQVAIQERRFPCGDGAVIC